jgi:hypothetical protein
MRYKIIKLLPLLAALAVCGCQTVKSKKPVGDKTAELKPEEWNGKWQSGDGSILATRIKDSKLGLVELVPVHPRPKPDEPKMVDVVVRTLGTNVIASTKEKPTDEGYNFGRIAIDNTHLVVFAPDAPAFANLVKRGKLAGTLDKDKDGKPTGSSLLEGFSEQDYQRLVKGGVDVRSLFSEDPVIVLVRVH